MKYDPETKAKLQELAELKARLAVAEGLPFLALHMYPWQKEFFTTWEKTMLLTAGNQLGKSTIHACKVVNFATNKDLWHKLFPEERSPNFSPVIWYLYPDKDTITQEFENKWAPYILPQGRFKDDPRYGWKATYKDKSVQSILFNSGAKLYFKSYNQDAKNLQAGTVQYIACDEELPYKLYPELVARLFGSDGYFSMVFTATLAQEEWRKAMEPTDEEKLSGQENLPDAWKKRASAFDSMVFADGKPSKWTEERIKANIAKCTSQAEIDRRIYGKFVKDEGLMYPCFDRARNYVPYPVNNGKEYRGVPKGWHVISGVDIGSSGENHPAAIAFLSVSPDKKKLRVFRGKRMDTDVKITSGDVLAEYIKLKDKLQPMCQSYDFACVDFGTLADRAGLFFKKADKSRVAGVGLVNTLFKFGILKIYRCDEHEKLVNEYESLSLETAKTHAKDDFTDAVRYAVLTANINWKPIIEEIVRTGGYDETGVIDKVEVEKPLDERELRAEYTRKKSMGALDKKAAERAFISPEARLEIGEMNELYGEYF